MQKCSAWGTALSPIPRYTVVLKRLCKTLETCEEYLRKHYLGTQFEKKKKKVQSLKEMSQLACT